MVSSDPKVKKPTNPLARYEDLISTSETLLCCTPFHWIILFWPAAIAIPFSLLAVDALIELRAHGHSPGSTVLLAGIGLFSIAAVALMGLVTWESGKVIITNRRLIVVSRIFRVETTSVELDVIESATLRQGPLGKKFGFGTVAVSRVGGSVELIRKITSPEQLYLSLQEQLELRGGAR